jgi:uncharacterized protein (DUF305 family)
MRRIALALLAAAAVLLTACNQGAPQQGGGPASAAPNDADVTFTQNMIPHHQQAIEMATLVDAHTKRSELRTLAEDITTSQGQEITLMQGWLRSWGKPATPAGMDHGAMQMPGMMSEMEMRQLGVINGEDFDLLFLEMMTAHHKGAIEMATVGLRDGSLPEVKRLAQQILDAQQAEIDQFKQWNKEWLPPPNR